MNTRNSTRSLTGRFAAVMLALIIVTAALASTVSAAYPKPTDNVADAAGILSEGTIRSIRNANESTAAEVGAIIAVCTVSTTGDTSISEYARGVFRDWKLGESILILIAVDDMNYFFLPSTAIDTVLTSDEIREITNEYLEGDFVEGNVDTGVMKVAAKLSSILSGRLEKIEDNKSDDGEKKTAAGSVIVGFFKVLLIIALIAIAAFVILFVVAMFNDDVAALFQKYIFKKKQKPSVPVVQYDERLYGRPQRPQQPPQRPQQNGQQGQRQAPQQRPQNGGYTGYSDYLANPQPGEYYNSNGTRRR